MGFTLDLTAFGWGLGLVILPWMIGLVVSYMFTIIQGLGSIPG